MSRAGIAALVGCGALFAAFACNQSDAPPFLSDPRTSGDSKPDAAPSDTFDIPPPKPPAADAGGLCGNVIVPLTSERPNLYFILDASGSMQEYMDGRGPPDKYTAAKNAIQAVLRAVGHRANYGLAWYPTGDPMTTDGCVPGKQMFPTQAGDPPTTSSKNGPVLAKLMSTLNGHDVQGLTPTAATIAHLHDTIAALPGKTYVILLTDGAPNCATTECTAKTCTVNIQRGCPDSTINCCDPTYQQYDERFCLDSDPTIHEVARLAEAGIPTYVLGMPGTEAYTDLLGRVATAGNTARDVPPYYYPVDNSGHLTSQLRSIVFGVSVSCEVEFETPPPDQRLVNVFFDETVVPQDPENGWTWDGDSRLVLVGKSCSKLKSGDVFQLQVTAGCPSVTR